jgi:crotonobetainyl-CoA:carnitine CoA-transferase CaiB-like acyl-CoA transferase
MRLRDTQGHEHIGTPVKFRDEPGEPRFSLPAVGEHTHEVLRSLGYDDSAIAAIEAASRSRSGAHGGK